LFRSGFAEPVTSHQNIVDLAIYLKILDVSLKPSSASLDRRNSPATLGLAMSENPINGPASEFSRSGAMTAIDSHESHVPRMRGRETPHHERLFERNKQLSSKRPLIMSGFPARPPKIGFASHPIHILECFPIFSIRWALFRIFPFSSASIRVNPRPHDFSQVCREWLCFEECPPAGCLDHCKLSEESE
jgi:hypothetical protein